MQSQPSVRTIGRRTYLFAGGTRVHAEDLERLIEPMEPSSPHTQPGFLQGVKYAPRNPEAPSETLERESTGPKRDKAELIKARCPQCGMVIRLAGKWVSETSPACPNIQCDRHDKLMEI